MPSCLTEHAEIIYLFACDLDVAASAGQHANDGSDAQMLGRVPHEQFAAVWHAGLEQSGDAARRERSPGSHSSSHDKPSPVRSATHTALYLP